MLAFNLGIVGRGARTAEIAVDATLVDALAHEFRNKLTAIVDLDCGRWSSLGGDAVQRIQNVFSLQAPPDLDGQAFTAAVLNMVNGSRNAPALQQYPRYAGSVPLHLTQLTIRHMANVTS